MTDINALSMRAAAALDSLYSLPPLPPQQHDLCEELAAWLDGANCAPPK